MIDEFLIIPVYMKNMRNRMWETRKTSSLLEVEWGSRQLPPLI